MGSLQEVKEANAQIDRVTKEASDTRLAEFRLSNAPINAKNFSNVQQDVVDDRGALKAMGQISKSFFFSTYTAEVKKPFVDDRIQYKKGEKVRFRLGPGGGLQGVSHANY